MTAATQGQAALQYEIGRAPISLHFTPFYLLSNLRGMTGRMYDRHQNWELASRLFAVGCTTATRLCKEAGIDPDGLEVRPTNAKGPAA